ncbi:uncharacterized protein LOC120847391, partial [Ixodes scapularis]|uniref:uncharacterized protein LOC120847391 n=1 Tax=Ixodes scapularis TaxID=6945 RepID=UPI001C391646
MIDLPTGATLASLFSTVLSRRTLTTATSTRHLFFVGVRFIKPVCKELVTTLKGLTSYVLVFKLVPRGGPFGQAREDERLSLNRLLVQKGVALGVTIVNVDRLKCILLHLFFYKHSAMDTVVDTPVPQPRQHCQPRQAGYRPVQRVPCQRHPA